MHARRVHRSQRNRAHRSRGRGDRRDDLHLRPPPIPAVPTAPGWRAGGVDRPGGAAVCRTYRWRRTRSRLVGVARQCLVAGDSLHMDIGARYRPDVSPRGRSRGFTRAPRSRYRRRGGSRIYWRSRVTGSIFCSIPVRGMGSLSDPIARLTAALGRRYTIERELGRGRDGHDLPRAGPEAWPPSGDQGAASRHRRGTRFRAVSPRDPDRRPAEPPPHSSAPTIPARPPEFSTT